MSRKMKRVSMESSPSHVVDEEAKSRSKYQTLLQEYKELQKDTHNMITRMQITKQRKQTLLDEVRFLRRKYKFLMKNGSSNSPPARDLAQTKNSEIQGKIVANDRIYSVKQNSSPVLDLNQISRGEEEDVQVILEPSRMEKKPKKCLASGAGSDEQHNNLKLSLELMRKGKKPKKLLVSTESEDQLNDLKLSICKDIGNRSSQTGKKKLSWLDQVALKV